MKTKLRTGIWSVIAPAVVVMGVLAGVPTANGAASLWISAPLWSYSAAAAASPAGSVYFWGLSVGAGSYSWAGAFSNDGLGDAAYAFAMASASNRGGVGAVNVAGFADPYADVGIDYGSLDPSNPSSFPSSEPGSNPFSIPVTDSDSGITLSGSGEELSGNDELQAFVYPGGTSMASLEADLGVSSESGNTSSGDVDALPALISDFGLIPLDPLIDDPGSLSDITFTENTGDIDGGMDNIILVGESDAEEVPEPVSASLLAVGGLGLLARRRRVTV